MKSMILHLEDKENKKVEKLAAKWELSKANTIRKIVKDFKE
jgi:hypothetical protein